MASVYLKNKLADHVNGKAAFTMPEHIWLGLSTADPLDDASGLAEPVGGDYARVQMDPADWAAAVDGLSSNVNVVTFPTPTGSWGTLTHIARFDAASGGNMLDKAVLPSPQTVDAGSTAPKFQPGTIKFKVT